MSWVLRSCDQAVIPCNTARKTLTPYDDTASKLRNRIERLFNKLKHFRRITPRYDRRPLYFLAVIPIASVHIWMR